MIGVITADIVNSRKIAPLQREALYRDIGEFLKDLEAKQYIRSFETFRGDSFQCIAKDLNKTLTVAVLIRSFIKHYDHHENSKDREKPGKGYSNSKYDIRTGLGIDKTDFINNRISHSDGEAFYKAAEALNKLEKTNYRINILTSNQEVNELLEPAMLLLDSVIQKWTSNQAEIVYYKLQLKQEDEIAEILKISQSAVNQRSKTSNWYAIEKSLTLFENNIEKWI